MDASAGDCIRIYYLTGTGNSLAIARHIAGEFTRSELISMTGLARDRKIHMEGGAVGFVLPVYFARPPAFMEDFIERISFGNISYLFAVMNGGGLFGRAMHQFDGLLEQKGRSLDAGFLIKMPGNHPRLASRQRRAPEELYAEEAARSKSIAALVKSGQPAGIETNWGLLGRFFSGWAFRDLHRRSLARTLDSDYHVTDACQHCGTCQRICPTGNITDSETMPRWHHNCINCAACYHHCPAKAICLGNEDPEFRYTHPDVSAEDIIEGCGVR